MTEDTSDPFAPDYTISDTLALKLAVSETDRARKLHDHSMERANNDRRLRILVEEVGEISRALEDLEFSSDTDACEQHLLDEVVQTASAALRWVAALNGPRAKSSKPIQVRSIYHFVTEAARQTGREIRVEGQPLGPTLTGVAFDVSTVVCTQEDLDRSQFSEWVRELRRRGRSVDSKLVLQIL